MIKLMTLCALLTLTATPIYAMSENSTHYSGTDKQANYADPDDAEEQFSDAPRTAGTPSGREQSLLGGQNSGPQQTYGFSSGFSGYSSFTGQGADTYYSGDRRH